VPDHFSLVVQIFGSPEVNLNNGQSTPISYFVLNNAPFTYTDGGKMVEDAGILTANYFKNGWACPK
jgi:membrane-bound lytic murein transglycosylase